MEKIAHVVSKVIVLLNIDKIANDTVLTTTCSDFNEFKNLPQVVSYQGTVCGKTGWNSDVGHAYYKSNVPIAYARTASSKMKHILTDKKTQ